MSEWIIFTIPAVYKVGIRSDICIALRLIGLQEFYRKRYEWMKGLPLARVCGDEE